MGDTKQQHDCPNCAKLSQQIAELTAQIAELKAHNAALTARMEDLESKLANAKKNSSNSSKPPSTDIVSPKEQPRKGGTRKKRKRGGQPGHKRHEREPFEPGEIDEFWTWGYSKCPCCDGELVDGKKPVKTLQQVELPVVPVTVAQHDIHAQHCSRCNRTFIAQFPEELRKAGLIGPRLTALVGFLKGACHMSYSAIRKYFRDVIGVKISRGMLRKLVGKVSDALADPYEALLALLEREKRLNIDETGHKENGRRLWTWCFRAYLYTVYKISPSRGSQVLVEVLGEEFNGILGCDYFSAYRKYMKDFGVLVQFCLAHFIRDVKFLADHSNPKNRAYGKRLLADLRKLFGVIHRRDEYASEKTFQRALERARDQLMWDAMRRRPYTKEASNLSKRFRDNAKGYFRFITEPDVEPTNNLAEQAIRFVAIHRRITQGTRSEDGRRWCERIWTVIQTCRQQQRSVFEFLCRAVESHFRSAPAPALVPDTS